MTNGLKNLVTTFYHIRANELDSDVVPIQKQLLTQQGMLVKNVVLKTATALFQCHLGHHLMYGMSVFCSVIARCN